MQIYSQIHVIVIYWHLIPNPITVSPTVILMLFTFFSHCYFYNQKLLKYLVCKFIAIQALDAGYRGSLL